MLAADFGYKTFIDMLQALTICLNYRNITPPQSIDWRERIDISMRHGGVDRPHSSIPKTTYRTSPPDGAWLQGCGPLRRSHTAVQSG